MDIRVYLCIAVVQITMRLRQFLMLLIYYRVYANRTHDPITTRKFNSRNVCILLEREPLSVIFYGIQLVQ